MKRALSVLTAAAILTACDSTGVSTRLIERVEMYLTPTSATYPVGDTLRGTAVAFSPAGTIVHTELPTWRSLNPDIVRVDADGFMRAVAPGEATIEVEINGVTARAQLTVRGLLHIADLDRSETWFLADTPHVVRGYLNVGGFRDLDAKDTAVLTLEPGVTVRFRRGSGLYFADIEPGALVIPPGSAPVIFEGDSAARGFWRGLSFEGPGRSELRNVTLRHCGGDSPSGPRTACLEASGRFQGSGPNLLLDRVSIADAHDGVNITHWVTIASGSRELSVENTEGYVATLSPQVAGSFPRGGRFEGNTENEIHITNGLVEQSAEWTQIGPPWRLTGGVIFSGPANPVLTIPPGLVIRADPAGSLVFETGGLVAGATDGPPLVMESTGDGWGGIEIVHGGGSALRNVTLRDCGSTEKACLRVEAFDDADIGILADNLTIRGARSAGVHFGIWGHFHEDSRNITIRESGGVPLDVSLEAIRFIPSGEYRFNGVDAIRVRGITIWRSMTWRNLGIPYMVPDGILVNWTLDLNTPTLTLEPGVEVLFGVGTLLTLDVGRLVGVGTESAPIVFGAVTRGVPGSWMGIELQREDLAALRLEHVIIEDAGAGPPGYSGALRLYTDPGGVLRNSLIRRSTSCGIVLLGGDWADDYGDPALGNTFVDVAGPAMCRP